MFTGICIIQVINVFTRISTIPEIIVLYTNKYIRTYDPSTFSTRRCIIQDLLSYLFREYALSQNFTFVHEYVLSQKLSHVYEHVFLQA